MINDQKLASFKCLHIVESLDLRHGGVARSVIDLANALNRNGVRTTLASPDFGCSRTSIDCDDLCSELPRGRSTSPQARNLMSDADIVHLHTPWWSTNPSLVRMAVSLGKPVVLSSHGMLDDWSLAQKPLKKWVYTKLIAGRMIKRCVMHCTAEEELRQVLKRVAPIKSEVIPLVIDQHFFDVKLDDAIAVKRWPFLANLGQKKILFLGRVHPKKGLDIAIRTIAKLKDCLLVVAGPEEPEYTKELKELADALGVASRVHWIGVVFGDEKDSLLSSCDCILLPTQQENFGLVHVESLAMGLHVITTSGTDIWRELKDCGAMIIDRTPEAMATAVNKCEVSNREIRLVAQRQRLYDWIAPKATTERYIAMYASLLG